MATFYEKFFNHDQISEIILIIEFNKKLQEVSSENLKEAGVTKKMTFDGGISLHVISLAKK